VTRHASDNAGDRAVGAKWEARFQELANASGYTVTANQKNRSGAAVAVGGRNGGSRLVLPDMLVLGRPNQYHEIKHKNPTAYGSYGLEAYRFAHLLEIANQTDDLVLYTIHDWHRAGATNSRADMENRLEDWVTADVRLLQFEPRKTFPGKTYVNGTCEIADIHYWSADLWMPLSDFWAPVFA